MKTNSNLKITVEKPSQEKLEQLKVKNWSIWTKEASKFDWYYEESEQCYFLEGDVTVHTTNEKVSFGKGDFVTFPKGLKCQWEIRKPVRKHYLFG